MKRIIQIYLPFVLLPLLFSCGTKDSSHSKDDVQEAAEVASGAKDSVTSVSEDSTEADTDFLDMPIAEYSNIQVYADHSLNDNYRKYGDDITAKDETCLIRYIDDVPLDTMVIKGPYNSLSGKGNLCMITIGNETVNVNISRRFNKFIDVRYAGILPECRFFRFSRHYRLSERSFPTDFQVNVAKREDDPEYIVDFINKWIRGEVARYFDDAKIPLFNIKEGDYTRMSQYYYNQFCKLYKKNYSGDTGDDGIPPGPCYSFQCYAYPVWESPDSSLVTWKFYNYRYMGGAHGGETEYFLTFDNETGRILGANDFFGKKEFRKAIDTLTRQLNAYHGREPYGEFSYSADLDTTYVFAAQSKILNETIGKEVYPRPALTRKGIIFSYQTYEKGGNADGILHFTQPFMKDFTK